MTQDGNERCKKWIYSCVFFGETYLAKQIPTWKFCKLLYSLEVISSVSEAH